MNVIENKLHSRNVNRSYLLILLSLFLISCNSQSQNKSQIQQREKKKIENTTVKLKFTTGVGSIFEDSKGNFWFGSHQEGVCLFDGKSFRYFTVKDGLSDNQIRSIQEDDNGIIWFGTAKGVNSYDGKKIINQTPKSILNSNEWAKTDKDLWFNAGNSDGVYRYDGQKLNYLSFPKIKLINPNNVYHSTGFSKGKNNQIWMATYAGIFGYNGKAFTMINDEKLGLNQENGYLHIRSVLEDSKGNLWIGNNGIGVLLNKNDVTLNFSEKKGLIHLNSSRRGDKSPKGTLEHVFAIEEDSHGNIWFGDRDTGAWKYDGKTMTNYTMQEGLPSEFVLSIYCDKKGDLWVGTIEEGVYKFNGNTFERAF